MSRITRRQRQSVALVGDDYVLDFVSAQQNENLYPEISNSGEKPVLRSVPGTQRFAALSGAGRGLHVMNGVLYAVAGSVAYKIDSAGAATLLGGVLGSGLVSMADNGAQIAIATGTSLHAATPTSCTLVTDADAPLSPLAAGFLDAYILAVDGNTQEFRWSALDDATNWGGLDFASAEGAPDKLVGLIVDHREVWLAGTDSMEVWFNDGTTPFARSSGGYIEKGCAAGRTLRKLDNTIYWLGTDTIHGPSVYRAAGLQPERVSNNAIDAALTSYGDISSAYAYTYADGGHAFYCLTIPGRATWVYDASTQAWHRRVTWTQPDSNIVSIVRCYNKLLAQKTNGNIVELLSTLNEDEGEVIRRRRVLPTVEFGRRRFTIHRAEALASTGTAAVSVTPTIELEVSRDRGRTWSDPQPRPYGLNGAYRQRLIWGPLGGFRDAVLRLTSTSDVVSTMQEVSLDVEVHEH